MKIIALLLICSTLHAEETILPVLALAESIASPPKGDKGGGGEARENATPLETRPAGKQDSRGGHLSQYFHRKDRKWVRVIGTEEQFKRAQLATTGLGPRGIYTEEGFRLRWPHARIARTRYLH